MPVCTLSNKGFCLSATWKKKNPDLSFSNDRKVYEMRDREKGREREWREKARDRNIQRERWKCRNKETKSLDLEQTPKDHRHGFLADTSDCTGRISTTKLLIMHDYARHLLSALSGEVFVTHLQNDPVCLASWKWKITTCSLENVHITQWKTKIFAALYRLMCIKEGQCNQTLAIMMPIFITTAPAYDARSCLHVSQNCTLIPICQLDVIYCLFLLHNQLLIMILWCTFLLYFLERLTCDILI